MSKATFVEQSVPPPPPAAGRITIYGLNSFMYSIDEFGVITLLSGTVGQTDLDVQKSTAGTLNVGELVYLVGWDVADGVVTAELARADASSTMPALGIISEAATQTATGKVRILGELDGLDTSAWPDGTSVFVSASVAGGLTSTRPTGATDLVQRFGKVAYQHVSAGVLTIANAGRSNALPNLTNGNLWIGDGSNQPVETSAAGLGATVFSDSVFRVQDNGDATKQLAFEVSAIATATTRTLTVPNRSLNLGNYKATLLFSDYTVGTTTTARYLFPGGNDDTDAHVDELQMEVPYAGTIRNLRVVHTSVGVGGATITYTVRKGGANQSVFVAITAATAGGSDTTNSFTVVAGDKISVGVTKSGTITTSPTHVVATMEIEAS